MARARKAAEKPIEEPVEEAVEITDDSEAAKSTFPLPEGHYFFTRSVSRFAHWDDGENILKIQEALDVAPSGVFDTETSMALLRTFGVTYVDEFIWSRLGL